MGFLFVKCKKIDYFKNYEIYRDNSLCNNEEGIK